jgi:hypothetical protein
MYFVVQIMNSKVYNDMCHSVIWTHKVKHASSVMTGSVLQSLPSLVRCSTAGIDLN